MNLAGLFVAATFALAAQVPPEKVGNAAHPKPPLTTRASSEALTVKVAPNLKHAPALPPRRKNLIDEYIFGKIEQDGVPHASICTDEEFIRRVYLDLWGRIPQPENIRALLKDAEPDNRDR